MYEKKKTLILSGDFRFCFSAENECLFSFSAVNGVSFSSVFSFTAENENAFRSASSNTFFLPISTFSAIEVFHVMRYINVRYLLTYLLIHGLEMQSLRQVNG